jgi:hypothetical protein
MRLTELTLENIKCFENVRVRFDQKHRWFTLLSPNAGGKTTLLQAAAVMLAGPEAVRQLYPRPEGWVRDVSTVAKIGAKLFQAENDPGDFGGDERKTHNFGYTMHVVSPGVELRGRIYNEPSFIENPDARLTWLRNNAFLSKGTGWFAVGYGAFRRLTRSSQIIIPSLEPQARFTNFLTQFNEDEPLSAFERWMVYLDYRISKERDPQATARRDLGIFAINRLLPSGVRFDSINADGRILFDVNGSKVPTIGLSDGYRSVLALAGDLVWRLIQAFPESGNPLHEEGVVLIDELDIHLHPLWQRDISSWLLNQFPSLQFIVATHSPLVAAGAGSEAITMRLTHRDGKSTLEQLPSIAAMNVDRILQSDAFGLVSPFSPQTQGKLDRYDELIAQSHLLTAAEKKELQQLELFVEDAKPGKVQRAKMPLMAKIDLLLAENP